MSTNLILTRTCSSESCCAYFFPGCYCCVLLLAIPKYWNCLGKTPYSICYLQPYTKSPFLKGILLVVGKTGFTALRGFPLEHPALALRFCPAAMSYLFIFSPASLQMHSITSPNGCWNVSAGRLLKGLILSQLSLSLAY